MVCKAVPWIDGYPLPSSLFESLSRRLGPVGRPN